MFDGVGVLSPYTGPVASISPEIAPSLALGQNAQSGTVIEAREYGISGANSESMEKEPPVTPEGVGEGGYVASKNGTKYHFPWCGSAKQIKEENKIWFKTKAEAEAAGYTPASNCKGI